MTDVSISGGGLLLLQVAILVLYYGTNVFSPSVPWWIIWLPTLIVLLIIGIGLLILLIGFIMATLFNW